MALTLVGRGSMAARRTLRMSPKTLSEIQHVLSLCTLASFSSSRSRPLCGGELVACPVTFLCPITERNRSSDFRASWGPGRRWAGLRRSDRPLPEADAQTGWTEKTTTSTSAKFPASRMATYPRHRGAPRVVARPTGPGRSVALTGPSDLSGTITSEVAYHVLDSLLGVRGQPSLAELREYSPRERLAGDPRMLEPQELEAVANLFRRDF